MKMRRTSFEFIGYKAAAWLWHVSCDIAWNSLWANLTIRISCDCDIGPKTLADNVTCHMSQSGVWLWHWPKDCSRQCHNSHVTIRGLIVTLAQRLFQVMSQLSCHNQGYDCDIGPKTVPGNVTTHMSQSRVWLWHWHKDYFRQCHISHVTTFE